jgi:phage terminase large subunit
MRVELPAKMAETLFKPSRYKVYYGGRGGAKSQSIARALLVQGYTEKHKILCAREIQKSIQDSVHSLLKEQIEELGLQDFYEVQKSTILGRNGTEFLFAGLRSNIGNIKSIPKLTRAWIEEAQSASASNIKTVARTVREPDSEIWLSLNPDLEDDPVYQEFIADPPSNSIVVKINYDDNAWFPDVLRQDMEDDKRKNFQNYEHVWLGKPKQAVEGAIFAEEISKAFEEHRITTVPVQVGVPVQTFWDLGQSDNTAIWFIQIVGMEFRVVDYYQASGHKMPHYIGVLDERAYKYDEHCLPHDADYDQQAANSTIRQQLESAIENNPKLGNTVQIVPRIPKKALGIDAARAVFSQCLFDKEKTKDGMQCLRHYAYAKDTDTGKVSKEPKHDMWSHGSDAFLCFAQYYKKPESKTIKSFALSQGRGTFAAL